MFDKSWLRPVENVFGNGYVYYTIINISKFRVEKIGSNDLLIIYENPNKISIEWIYLNFDYSDEENKVYRLLMEGSGLSASLREPRHTYFIEDENGYVFYIKPKHIARAFEILSEYFDYEEL